MLAVLNVRRFFEGSTAKNKKKYLPGLRVCGENNLTAFCPKKVLHQPAAVVCAHIGYDFNAMIEPIILRVVIQRSCGSPFGIGRTENYP